MFCIIFSKKILEPNLLRILKSKSLLLLEDNEEFICNAKALFDMFFEKTYIAKTLSEAREIAEKNNPDVIFSDIHLKNENGLDFVREFRDKNTTTPIAILSGHKDEEFLFRAMTLGLSGYLLKPINFKELVEALENCSKNIAKVNISIFALKDNYIYDRKLKTLSRNNEIFELNKKEILFFDMLVDNTDKVLTREMFEAFVWNYTDMTDSALNNFVMRIRRRFGKQFLHTIPDVGYKMII